ncbi:hypothetical protein J6590_100780, partial [Homalodisca vitripennis]
RVSVIIQTVILINGVAVYSWLLIVHVVTSRVMRRGVGDCDADTILSAPRFALGGCCMPSSFSQWYGRGVLVVGSIITLNKKKPSWSPVNEATVRQLLEQEESEDEMSSAIDDTDSDPDYDPSGFRDQPHTPDL